MLTKSQAGGKPVGCVPEGFMPPDPEPETPEVQTEVPAPAEAPAVYETKTEGEQTPLTTTPGENGADSAGAIARSPRVNLREDGPSPEAGGPQWGPVDDAASTLVEGVGKAEGSADGAATEDEGEVCTPAPEIELADTHA